MTTSREIAAAYWISYFTLHWLLILDVIEFTPARGFCTVYFFLGAILTSINVAAHELAIAKAKREKQDE